MTVTRRALLGATLATPALAQSARFPDRPIELVVGFAPGGGTDVNMRSFARFFEARLGGSVVVVNRPGAGTEVAMASVARTRPDRSTLGAATLPTLVTIPIERQAQFKLEAFVGIGQIASDPNAFSVSAAGPYTSMAQAGPCRSRFAPAGTPPEILARLRQAAEEAAKDEAFARALEQQFTEVRFIPGAEWFAQLGAMQDRCRALRAKTPWRER
jgi:tripartite-type tricarboxylate transporter receptor subunit TctC